MPDLLAHEGAPLHCAQCGAQLQPGDRFCGECGHPVSLAKIYPVQVRLDAYERARLEEIAAAWGVSLSVALRRLIREAKFHAVDARRSSRRHG
jgi:predicted amidophosphoribosyltransferase